MIKLIRKIFGLKSGNQKMVIDAYMSSFKNKKLNQELIERLRNGDVYVHSLDPTRDNRLMDILNAAFGNHHGIYDTYRWYGKFGSIHAGQYSMPREKTLEVDDFYL